MKNRKSIYEKLEEEDLRITSIEEKEEKIQDLELILNTHEEEIAKNQAILNDQNSFIKKMKTEFEIVAKKEQELVLEDMKKKQEALMQKITTKKKELISEAELKATNIVQETNASLAEVIEKTTEYQTDIENYSEEYTKLVKEVNRYRNQARKFKADVLGLKNFNVRFPHTINFEKVEAQLANLNEELDEDQLLGTVIRLHLHSDNSKELRKLSNATKREVKNLLVNYEDRYTTKGNKTIYNLMVIGLQAEIQILLLQLKYNEIDEAKEVVKNIITKYLALCASGNQSILPTITKFLTEIEPLYMELIEIEYKYYVYREQEKEEQKMLKEQMRQEAEERKRLVEERKKLDQEEQKFIIEMNRNRELLALETDDDKVYQLQERLRELEMQVQGIDDKKEEIANLTLGKAGYVYIISNLGSFGEEIFKVGMTRRMEPQNRVDELGSASVPFKFDVHALIFSEDAVGLENKLHKLLSDKRVNKVNYRKEFFRTDVEEIQQIVEEIDPTVEFVTTMLAEEYRQSKSMRVNEQVS